ncbi:MAG: BspA family leucine-rich repeat surface protein, partial [Prevotella sp.]|nr:BspA family leucine-rich repeat surface protein [Prevotella sp.]
MKRRFLLLVAALLMMCSGVKADNVLYAVVDGTTMTLKYGDESAMPTGAKKYGVWSWSQSFCSAITTAIIDESCKNYSGTGLNHLFFNWVNLTTIKDLTNLNTANVTTMESMFSDCKSLESLDLSGFKTDKVTNMSQMFGSCTELKSVIVGDNWNTGNVTTSSAMFSHCTKLVGEDGTICNGVLYADEVAQATTGTGGYLTKKTVTVAANTVGSDNWATYYKSNVNRKADANTTVYKAAVSGDKMTLTEISDKIIKAGQAVILKSSAASITLTSTIDDATGDFTGNVLEGVDVVTDRASGNTYYVLGSGSAGIG